MKQLFGNIKMRWPRVILFAILAGIYAGLVMILPFLKDTSFQDIGISYEWWVIFAVIIVVNCEKCWDAMLKCFVFFLISQPFVYLVEVVSGTLTFERAWYYYSVIWLPMTFLTLPGGFIAYFCKKQNALGAIILGLGNTIQVMLAIAYSAMMIQSFPHHLLSIVVCLASIIIMTLCVQRDKRNRLISFAVPVMLSIVILIFLKLTGRVII